MSDDEDEEWEDSQSEGGSVNEDHLFDKQDTRLTSRPSMLSTLFKSKSDYNLPSHAFRAYLYSKSDFSFAYASSSTYFASCKWSCPSYSSSIGVVSFGVGSIGFGSSGFGSSGFGPSRVWLKRVSAQPINSLNLFLHHFVRHDERCSPLS
jgi:hypothetical protein